MNYDELVELLSQLDLEHGAHFNPFVLDPFIEIKGKTLGGLETVENPTPTVRYIFRDGSYLDVLPSANVGVVGTRGEQVHTGTYTVKGGTALKKEGAQKTYDQYYEDPQGNYWGITPDGKKVLIIEAPTPQDSPQDIAYKKAQINNLKATTARTKQLVAGGTPLDIAQQKLQIQKAQQDLIPPASLMYQQMNEAIRYMQQQLEAGAITPDQATAYIEGLRQQFDAALRGTTPYQEAQGKIAQQNIQQNLGWDILNRNAERATSLAASLTNAAGGMAQRAMMPVGKTSLGVDPLAIARTYAEQAGGGPQMADFARQLLMGAQGQTGGPPQSQQQNYPTTREAVLALYPELAGR